jgi:hypothetical protein
MLKSSSAESGANLESGTWPLADIATVKMRGGDIPESGSQAEEIILAAWKVHLHISGKSMRSDSVTTIDGVDALAWTGNLIDVFHFLWPVGRPPVRGLAWDEGYRTVKDWLLLNKNIGVVRRGNQELNSRKTGFVASRATSWWVREELLGVPQGMKLPGTSTPGQVIDQVRAAAPAAALPVSADDPNDWWCAVGAKGGVCMEDGPYTRTGLGIHVAKHHKFRFGSFMYEKTIGDAEELRNSRPTPAPVPEPAPEPPRPAPAIPPPPRIPPPPLSEPPPLSAPAPAVTQTIGGASISAQARVFSMQVAEVEQENAALRRRVAELEEELRRTRADERRVRLDQQDMDSIAHRVVHLMDEATS